MRPSKELRLRTAIENCRVDDVRAILESEKLYLGDLYVVSHRISDHSSSPSPLERAYSKWDKVSDVRKATYEKIYNLILQKLKSDEGEFFTAIENDDVFKVAEFIENGQFKVDQQSSEVGNRNTALICAAEKGSHKTLAYLLNKGANPNKTNDSKIYTPLLAACKSNDLESVALLLERGADRNFIGGGGKTPLIIAIQNKNFELVKLLCNYGLSVIAASDGAALLDVNFLDGNRRNALSHAAASGDEKIFGFLLSKGADIRKLDDKGKSICEYALDSENEEFALRVMAEFFRAHERLVAINKSRVERYQEAFKPLAKYDNIVRPERSFIDTNEIRDFLDENLESFEIKIPKIITEAKIRYLIISCNKKLFRVVEEMISANPELLTSLLTKKEAKNLILKSVIHSKKPEFIKYFLSNSRGFLAIESLAFLFSEAALANEQKVMEAVLDFLSKNTSDLRLGTEITNSALNQSCNLNSYSAVKIIVKKAWVEDRRQIDDLIKNIDDELRNARYCSALALLEAMLEKDVEARRFVATKLIDETRKDFIIKDGALNLSPLKITAFQTIFRTTPLDLDSAFDILDSGKVDTSFDENIRFVFEELERKLSVTPTKTARLRNLPAANSDFAQNLHDKFIDRGYPDHAEEVLKIARNHEVDLSVLPSIISSSSTSPEKSPEAANSKPAKIPESIKLPPIATHHLSSARTLITHSPKLHP